MPITPASCRSIVFLVAVFCWLPAGAHSLDEHARDSMWTMWNADPWVIAGMAVATVLYASGLRRLWTNARQGAGVPISSAILFCSGMAILVLALLSPIDTLGNELFSLHMVQHELLMLLAAPLLVTGRPLAVFVWAFPPGGRKRIARIVKSPVIRRPWHAMNQPLAAWTIHALVLWAWHFPSLFQASLANEGVHTMQHLSFFASALLFWSSLIGAHSQWQRGSAVLSLLTTAIHTGMLGALLTFSTRLWYPAYGDTTLRWGYTALEDQQLGGLIMWVPAGFLFVFAGLAFAAMMLLPAGAAARRD
jgi:putative membrane protein